MLFAAGAIKDAFLFLEKKKVNILPKSFYVEQKLIIYLATVDLWSGRRQVLAKAMLPLESRTPFIFLA